MKQYPASEDNQSTPERRRPDTPPDAQVAGGSFGFSVLLAFTIFMVA